MEYLQNDNFLIFEYDIIEIFFTQYVARLFRLF